jgi:membrane protein DedA with SNARE-associated domain
MEESIGQLANHAPYVVIVTVILLGGLGLPVPEDVPLITAGYLAGQGNTDPWVMFPTVFVAVLCTDLILSRAEAALVRHGGKCIFATRFLPGLRSPVIFVAGVFRMPGRRFFFFDGAAALVGVPIILSMAYTFSDRIDMVRRGVAEGQLAATGLVVALTLAYVGFNVLVSRRIASEVGSVRDWGVS